MLVCHCFVIRARDVRSAIQSGARNACDVARACGAGGGCGGCVPLIEELLAERALCDAILGAAGDALESAGTTMRA
jgi:bacterioferritin-associated ferredoxin